MAKAIFNFIMVTGLLSLLGCSQPSGNTTTCYTESFSDTGTVLTKMENKPHFNGGQHSLAGFMSDNIGFEKLLSGLSQNGRMYKDTARMKFIVSKKGSLSNLSVTRAKEKMFADEIARVIKKSSCNWVAGKTDQLSNGWIQLDIYCLVEKLNNEIKTTMTLNEVVSTD